VWRKERGVNLLDSGAHFYDVYETSDGRHVAVGAIEPQFYALLLRGLNLDSATLPAQTDRSAWPKMKQRFADLFRTRTRDEWTAVFSDSDACVTPVLSPDEAARHPHARARGSFISAFGGPRPSAAPRFSRSQTGPVADPPRPGQHSEEILSEFGFAEEEITRLRQSGAVLQNATLRERKAPS
jgi:alpha-methylacyl-CoA racemase